jgi:cytidine deaminase
MERTQLLALAREAAQKAHCPYSHFRVGAALVAGGEIFTGVNIEISSYGLTLCAERSALAAAVSRGAGPITQVAVTCIPCHYIYRWHRARLYCSRSFASCIQAMKVPS